MHRAIAGIKDNLCDVIVVLVTSVSIAKVWMANRPRGDSWTGLIGDLRNKRAMKTGKTERKSISMQVYGASDPPKSGRRYV